MKKCIHNTEQAYFKEAFEQSKYGYFMSISEGASWPASWKQESRIHTDGAWTQWASLCPSHFRSTTASWAWMPVQGTKGTAPPWIRHNLAPDLTLLLNINNALGGWYKKAGPDADMASKTLTCHLCWIVGTCIVFWFLIMCLTQMMSVMIKLTSDEVMVVP